MCGSHTHHHHTTYGHKRDSGQVWSQIQADFKGPIGGRYYFNVMIDQLSRWPEV